MGRWDNNKTGLYGKWYDFVQKWGYGNNFYLTSSITFLCLGFILIPISFDVIERGLTEFGLNFAKGFTFLSFILSVVCYVTYKKGITKESKGNAQ